MPAVLFVDDEPMILKSIERSLRGESYDCFFANSGEEALGVLEAHIIDVLVTDMRMPGMRGLDLLKTAKDYYPNTVRVVLSGYTQINQLIVTINQGDIYKFVPKPWDVDTELKPAIDEALAYAAILSGKQTDQDRINMRNQLYQNVLARFESKKIRLQNNIETLKLTQEHTLKCMEDFLLHAESHFDDASLVSMRYTIEQQRAFHHLMPLRSVKMDYELAMALIREAVDGAELDCKPTFSKHTCPSNRVYGTVDLLSPLTKWVIALLQREGKIQQFHIEVTGNVLELLEHPDAPALHLSILMDIQCEQGQMKTQSLDSGSFSTSFSAILDALAPYAEIRYAFKQGRFVLQMKMPLERGA